MKNCNGLKLKEQDGKYRMTDVCDIEEMFRISEIGDSVVTRENFLNYVYERDLRLSNNLTVSLFLL